MKDLYVIKGKSKNNKIYYALIAECETVFGIQRIPLTFDWRKIRPLLPNLTDVDLVSAPVGTSWGVI